MLTTSGTLAVATEKLLLMLKIITIYIKLNFEPFYNFAIKPQP